MNGGGESGGDGGFRFHYNREERIQGLSDDARYYIYRQGKKRRNRSLLIIMIDIVVLIIIGYFMASVLGGRNEVEYFYGYRGTLSALVNGDRAYLSLRLEPRSDRAGRSGEEPAAEGDEELRPQQDKVLRVRFRIGGEASGEEMKDVLNPARTGTLYFEQVVEFAYDEKQSVEAVLTLPGETVTLEKTLKPE